MSVGGTAVKKGFACGWPEKTEAVPCSDRKRRNIDEPGVRNAVCISTNALGR